MGVERFHEPCSAMKMPFAVLLREHPAGVEAHAERGDVGTERLGRRGELVARAAGVEVGVADVVAVAEGEAEVLAGLGHAVELVGRLVVAEPVAPVLGEPELLGVGGEVEADAVAHTVAPPPPAARRPRP